jgi:hypothetical protein
MKNRLVMFCALLALTGMVTFAAAIDGKYTAETPGRGGGAPTTNTLMLKADGANLTGSLDGGRGPADISEGKIDGMNVTFKVVRDLGDKGKQTTVYAGMLMGDDLKLTATREGGGGKGGPQELAFKRAK